MSTAVATKSPTRRQIAERLHVARTAIERAQERLPALQRAYAEADVLGDEGGQPVGHHACAQLHATIAALEDLVAGLELYDVQVEYTELRSSIAAWEAERLQHGERLRIATQRLDAQHDPQVFELPTEIMNEKLDAERPFRNAVESVKSEIEHGDRIAARANARRAKLEDQYPDAFDPA